MINQTLVDLSRLQFAATAMYHFVFVPLTLGLVWLLVIMEMVYVMTGKPVWKDMTRFWGKLFGINFALGVTTGITLEFQVGTNWAYHSHDVGDVFGAPLAIEGLMAFFPESTFIGLFFFGWNRLSKTRHLMVTTLMAVGTNLGALWILIANAWRSTWDWGLFVGGAVPPLIFGVAFGNLLQGVPFHFDDQLVSTYTGSFRQLLNPFALLAGVVSSAMITMHGGTYLAHRPEGAIRRVP